MDITKRLLELDPTLQRHNEGFFNAVFDPTVPGYSAFNDAGIEVETGEFLYAFIRMLKPDYVLETGTHIGVGASYMGMALKDNHQGRLLTVEYLPEIHEQAVTRIRTMGLEGIVDARLGDVGKLELAESCQLILLDTEPQTRFAELLKFYPNLVEGGYLFIHDLHHNMGQGGINPDHPNEPNWPYGNIPDEMRALVTSGKLRPFHFESPRGLTGFYKVSSQDYQW